jgi:hypothetical protein
MSITITITIDHSSDAYEALELVGDCLSKGWQVSTSVSRPEFPKRAAADPQRRPIIDMRAERKAARKARIAAYEATLNPIDPEMLRAHQERHWQAQEARIVACPSCGATEGEFCRRPKGHHGAMFVHTARYAATPPVPA